MGVRCLEVVLKFSSMANMAREKRSDRGEIDMDGQGESKKPGQDTGQGWEEGERKAPRNTVMEAKRGQKLKWAG